MFSGRKCLLGSVFLWMSGADTACRLTTTKGGLEFGLAWLLLPVFHLRSAADNVSRWLLGRPFVRRLTIALLFLLRNFDALHALPKKPAYAILDPRISSRNS